MKKWIIGLLIGAGAAALGVGGAFAYNAAFPADQTTAVSTPDQEDIWGPQRGSGMYPQYGNGQQQGQNGPQSQNQNGQLPGQGQNQNGPQQGQGNNQQFGQTPDQQQNQSAPQQGQSNDQQFGQGPNQQQDGNRGGMPGMNGMGMFDDDDQAQGYSNDATNTGERITLDTAYENAKDYISSLGSNLEVSKIMEFENEDYALVTESDTGRGAIELSVDPYTGNVTREMVPANMWNLKYGQHNRMMGNQTDSDSTLTLADAVTKAKESLGTNEPKAVLKEEGISFYGYYTFVYTVDGQVEGILSVNGISGSVSYHHWLGTFISEKEF